MSENGQTLRKALEAPDTPTTIIGTDLVHRAIEASRQSQRRRIILPLHKSPESNLHRMLNAVQPHSYVQPHRHLHPPKAESIVVLLGAILTLTFDGGGKVGEARVLAAGGADFGIDFEPGVIHTFFALAPDTVIFEVKPGPYIAATDKDFASWAPAEGDPSAAGYMAHLYQYAGPLGWPVPGRE